jgi:hypothetical protein
MTPKYMKGICDRTNGAQMERKVWNAEPGYTTHPRLARLLATIGESQCETPASTSDGGVVSSNEVMLLK